ncbi:MAG: phosphotransferase [Acidobacteria bacterium]|nr:phosphotransferase [Acidobacteriota bacterium]
MAQMTSTDLPDQFVKNIVSLSGDEGRAWLNRLPGSISNLEARWSIRVGRPFRNINFNYTAPAESADGRSVVLKIAPPINETEILAEAKYLRTIGGNGAVRLFEESRQDRALLIERALPGTTVAKTCRDQPLKAVEIATDLLNRIRMQAPIDQADVIRLDDWFENLERCFGTAFPSEYAARAIAIYSRLGSAASPQYLHGDLHAENIVAFGDGFALIDPKGMVGALGFEVAVFLNNFHRWIGERRDKLQLLTTAVRKFADSTGLTEQALREWAFAHSIVVAWWIFDEMPEQYDDEVVQSDIWGI